MSLVGLLYVILILALVGVIVWAITTYLPMPPIFKTIIYVIVAVAVILYLIQVVGGMAPARLR